MLECIKHIHFKIPQKISTYEDEVGNTITSAIHQAAVKQVETIENEILKQIRDMAVENGITDVYLLDKKNILLALQKQIPKRAVKHGFDPNKMISTIHYTCPICNKHISRENYCKHCGQALDWSDTNENL